MTEAAMTIRLLRGRGKYVLLAGGEKVLTMTGSPTPEFVRMRLTQALQGSCGEIIDGLVNGASK